MSELDGKTAVITGAASGPGLAAVRLFASEGARVYAAGHPAAQLSGSLVAIDGDVTAVPCGPGDLGDIARLAPSRPARSGPRVPTTPRASTSASCPCRRCSPARSCGRPCAA